MDEKILIGIYILVTLILLLTFSVMLLFIAFKKILKKENDSSVHKLIICFLFSLILFSLPYLFEYTRFNIDDDTLKRFSEINIESLYDFAENEMDGFSELTENCGNISIDVNGTSVLLYFYKDEDDFEKMKENPKEESHAYNFREKLLSNYHSYSESVIVVYPLERNWFPITIEALNEIAIYQNGYTLELSYFSKSSDDDFLSSLLNEIESMHS